MSRGAVIDGLAHRIEARGQLRRTEHAARARDGLVLPGPGGVAAALLLIVGIGVEGRDQQARVAVRAQRGVDLVQVTLAGLDGQPVDQLAHEGRIDLLRALVVVLVDEHDVEVAAVAEPLPPSLP